YHCLVHGSTLHGRQSLDPKRRGEPLAYYHPSGPIGRVFDIFQQKQVPRNMAVIGLGAGALACYAQPGERITFYEIDPAVYRIASDPRYFTYLPDAEQRGAKVAVVLGDARLRLREGPDGAFGLIVVDAFSSDAIPIHLLTEEAFALYLSKLAEGGLLAVHISN